MLEKQVLLAKFKTMILNIAKLHKNREKTNSGHGNLQNCREKLKTDNCM